MVLSGIPEILAYTIVFDLARDFEGQLWVATDSGVFVQSADGSQWTRNITAERIGNIVAVDSGLVSMQQKNFILDRPFDIRPYVWWDNLHLGCTQNGVWTTTCAKETVAYDTVKTHVLNCPKPGFCYASLQYGGDYPRLVQLDHGAIVKTHSFPGTVYDMALAPNGRIWVATGAGLFSLDSGTFEGQREAIGSDLGYEPIPIQKTVGQSKPFWSLHGRVLTFSGQAGRVELFDLLGNRQASETLGKNSPNMAIPHRGVWVVRFTGTNGAITSVPLAVP
jgi:hypothetical protein